MPYKRTRTTKKRGKIQEWVGQVMIEGKQSSRIFATKKEAKSWEESFKKKVKNPEKPKPETLTTRTTYSLHEASTKYLDFCTKFSPAVYSEKLCVLRRVIKRMGADKDIASITPGQALEHLQQEFKSRSGYSTNRDRKNLVAMYNWGVKYLGLPKDNPFEIEKFPEERHPRYIPSLEDFWAAYAVAQGQDQVLLLTLLHTAARKGELFRLKKSEVDFEKGLICLGTRKRTDGSLEYEWVAITDSLCRALKEHCRSHEYENVFVQKSGRRKGKPYKEYRGFPQKLCAEAGVRPFGCHAVRHLSASALAKASVPMISIQKVLRHKKLATTERYLHELDPERPHLEVLEGLKAAG